MATNKNVLDLEANIEGYLRTLLSASRARIFLGEDFDQVKRRFVPREMDVHDFLIWRKRELERFGLQGNRLMGDDTAALSVLLAKLLQVESLAEKLLSEWNTYQYFVAQGTVEAKSSASRGESDELPDLPEEFEEAEPVVAEPEPEPVVPVPPPGYADRWEEVEDDADDE